MNIIPAPKKIEITDGSACLSGKAEITSDDNRLKKAVDRLNIEKNDKGVSLLVSVIARDNPEAYRLEILRDRVSITGNSEKGAFWGIQTLAQIIKEYGSDNLPCCVIEDEPTLAERGYFHDVTRGKMPKLSTLKGMIDKLSLLKINSFQLYVEHAFAFPEYEGIVSPEEQLTADDIRELDAYCNERYIELIPCLATFGHLYYLLQSDRYRHLCERENYTPALPWFIEWMIHHTIDVYNPESIALIKSFIDSYAPLFSSKRFNICCDETFDLCEGRNKGKDKAEAYFYFVEKIIECVKNQGKEVMMWGDILLNNPELIDRLPKDVTVLNWEYVAAPDEARVEKVAALNRKQILCPGTSTWDCMIPWMKNALPNITAMARYAEKYNAEGIINTSWGDYGNIGSMMPSFYPMSVGAAVSWNPSTEIDDNLNKAASGVVFDDASGKSVELLCRLSDCENGEVWCKLCQWYAGWVELDFNPDDLKHRIKKCDEIAKEIKAFSAKGVLTAAFAENLLLGSRSVAAICRIALTAVSGEPFDTDCFEAWIKDYSAAWLDDNKPSELDKVTDFMRTLVAYVTGKSKA